MYLLFAARWLGRGSNAAQSEPLRTIEHHVTHLEITGDTVGDISDFGEDRRLQPLRAVTSSLVFFGVVLLAALDVAPIAATAFAASLLTLAGTAFAQYPAKPIKWIVPIAAGGPNDIMTRAVTLTSARRARFVEREADHYLAPPIDAFGMLEFERIDEIVEVGYRHALAALTAHRGEFP